jgi:hypothetical protein
MINVKRRAYEFELGARVSSAIVPLLLRRLGLNVEDRSVQICQLLDIGAASLGAKLYGQLCDDEELVKVLTPFLPIGPGDGDGDRAQVLRSWCDVQGSLLIYKGMMQRADARGFLEEVSSEDEVATLMWLHKNEQRSGFHAVEPVA